MSRLLGILLIFSLLAFGIYTYVKNFIVDKISGSFKGISVDRFNPSINNPSINLTIKLDIFNGSSYNFIIRKLSVSIYDNKSKKKIADSIVNNIVPINSGNNKVGIVIEDLNVLENAGLYFGGGTDLYIVVEFKILGIKVITQEIIKF